MVEQRRSGDGTEKVAGSAFEHVGKDRTRGVNMGHDVHLPAALPGVVRCFRSAAEGDAGIRAVDVDPAVGVDRSLDQLLDSELSGDIGWDRESAHFLRDGLRSLDIDVGDHDGRRTLILKPAAEGATNSAAAAGHHDDRVPEFQRYSTNRSPA